MVQQFALTILILFSLYCKSKNNNKLHFERCFRRPFLLSKLSDFCFLRIKKSEKIYFPSLLLYMIKSFSSQKCSIEIEILLQKENK